MKLQIANQFMQMGQVDRAKALYLQVLAQEPEHATAALALGGIYHAEEQFELAVKYLKIAATRMPGNANAHIKLADALRDYGHLDEAIARYRKALELQPDHPQALVTLALIRRNTEYGDDIRSLEALYNRPDLPPDRRRRLAFTLGKVFDELGQYDKAFEFLEEGNRLAQAQHRSTLRSEARLYDRIRTLFNTDFFRRAGDTGIADDDPILITGVPRCGSSLVEQILASHPDVHGAGEVEYIQRIIRATAQEQGLQFPDGFDTLPQAALRDMASRYVADLRSLAGREHHVTDKNMGSLLYIGLIATILPNATIIHCTRDPRDQGLSFFQQDFQQHQPNSYALEHIGLYYQIRQVLMKHWKEMMPGRIYEVAYEDFVADLELQTRNLLEHCGLQFDQACLRFHETERTVHTASLAQVRQPLYTSSVGRWKNYERQLQPLMNILVMDPEECMNQLIQ